MRTLGIGLIVAAMLAASPAGAQPASMNADQAYVRAVAYFETRFNAVRAEQATADAKAAAEMTALRAALKDAQRELAALKARDDASSRTVLAAFAAGDAGKGLGAAEEAARRATGDAKARWLETAALAAPLDPARAIAAYREALKIDAADTTARIGLANLLARSGDPGGAAEIGADLTKAAAPALRAQGFLILARAREVQGQTLQADGLYGQALEAALAAKDPRAALAARTRIGALAQAAGLWPKAEGVLKAALADAVALGDTGLEADVSSALAETFAARGLWAMANPLTSRALEIYEAAGDAYGKAGALVSLGMADMARPAPGLAEMRLREALQIYRLLRAPAGEAKALAKLGDATAALGRTSEACVNWRQAQAVYMRLGAGFSPDGQTVAAALKSCR